MQTLPILLTLLMALPLASSSAGATHDVAGAGPYCWVTHATTDLVCAADESLGNQARSAQQDVNRGLGDAIDLAFQTGAAAQDATFGLADDANDAKNEVSARTLDAAFAAAGGQGDAAYAAVAGAYGAGGAFAGDAIGHGFDAGSAAQDHVTQAMDDGSRHASDGLALAWGEATDSQAAAWETAAQVHSMMPTAADAAWDIAASAQDIAWDVAGDGHAEISSLASEGLDLAFHEGGALLEQGFFLAQSAHRGLEPDRNRDRLGDIWQESVCSAYDLGAQCDLFADLPAVAGCVQTGTDFDCDGLDLVEESCWGTDPIDADSDNDEWKDGPESLYWRALETGSDSCTVGGDFVIRYRAAMRDTDGDGRPNILDEDSDEDKLSDGQEASGGANRFNVHFGTQATKPHRRDSDQDGLTDYEELCARSGGVALACEGNGWGSDPNNPDSDGDGATDGVEALHWTDAFFDRDYDNDGSRNNLVDPDSDDDSVPGTGNSFDGIEMDAGIGSDPARWDSDSDGLPDGYELHYGMDPDFKDAARDMDQDGLSNGFEYAWARPAGWSEKEQGPWMGGFDPSDADMDDDLLPDGAELFGSFNSRFRHHAFYEGYPGSTNVLSRDTDGDTVSDHVELRVLDPHSDPNDSQEDSDGDGLLNAEETGGWYIWVESEPVKVFSDPADVDSDDDMLDDGHESRLGTNPRNRDTDDDGMPDRAEILNDCYPNNSDTDNDGLSDSAEKAFGSSCADGDSDDDGLSDPFELGQVDPSWNSDPLLADTDGDGLNDKQERTVGTEPRNLDTDEDGIPDGRESQVGVHHASNVDTDGDGLTDYQEEFYYYTSWTHADSDFDNVPDLVDFRPLVEDTPPALVFLGSRNYAYGLTMEVVDVSPVVWDSGTLNIDGPPESDCKESLQGNSFAGGGSHITKHRSIVTMSFSKPIYGCETIQFDLVDSNGNRLQVTLQIDPADYRCVQRSTWEVILVDVAGQTLFVEAAGTAGFILLGGPVGGAVAAGVASVAYDVTVDLLRGGGFQEISGNIDDTLMDGAIAAGTNALPPGYEVAYAPILVHRWSETIAEGTARRCDESAGTLVDVQGKTEQRPDSSIIVDSHGRKVRLDLGGFYHAEQEVALGESQEGVVHWRGVGVARVQAESGEPNLDAGLIAMIVAEDAAPEQRGVFRVYCGSIAGLSYEIDTWGNAVVTGRRVGQCG